MLSSDDHKAYLQRYKSGKAASLEPEGRQKKKRKKSSKAAAPGGMRFIDDDGERR